MGDQLGSQLPGMPADLDVAGRARSSRSAEGPAPVQGPDAVDPAPAAEAPPEPAPAVPAPVADASAAVSVFSFAGSVAAVAFTVPQPATDGQVVDLFNRRSGEVPQAIAVSHDGSLTVRFGDESVRMQPAQVIEAIRKGGIATGSELLQSVIVAQQVHSLGLSDQQAATITRHFVAALNDDEMPADARNDAYASAVMAACVSPDPAQSCRDHIAAVRTILHDNGRKFTPEDQTRINGARDAFLTAHTEALRSGDFTAAYDAQATFFQVTQSIAGQPLPELSRSSAHNRFNPRYEAVAAQSIADHAQAPVTTRAERQYARQALALDKGGAFAFNLDKEWGARGQVGVSAKPIPGRIGSSVETHGADTHKLAVASASVEGRIRRATRTEGRVQRDDQGQFVLRYTSFSGKIGGAVSAQASAVIPLAGGGVGGDYGQVTHHAIAFANATDLAKFMATLKDPDHAAAVRNQPQPAAVDVSVPTPGRYVVLDAAEGSATRTVSRTARFGFTFGSEKSTAVSKATDPWYTQLGNWFRRGIPGSSTRVATTETTKFTNRTGQAVTERTVTQNRVGGNIVVALLSGGTIKRSQVRSAIQLKVRTIAPSAPGVTPPPSSLAQANRPDLRFQIDSGKVKAAVDDDALRILATKEANRIIEVCKDANDGSNPPTIDLSDDGQLAIRDSVMDSLRLIQADLRRGADSRVTTSGDVMGLDAGLVVMGTGGGGGSSSGKIITLRLPFNEGQDGAMFRPERSRVEVGVATTFEKRRNARVGIAVDVGVANVGGGLYWQKTKGQAAYQRIATAPVVPPAVDGQASPPPLPPRTHPRQVAAPPAPGPVPHPIQPPPASPNQREQPLQTPAQRQLAAHRNPPRDVGAPPLPPRTHPSQVAERDAVLRAAAAQVPPSAREDAIRAREVAAMPPTVEPSRIVPATGGDQGPVRLIDHADAPDEVSSPVVANVPPRSHAEGPIGLPGQAND